VSCHLLRRAIAVPRCAVLARFGWTDHGGERACQISWVKPQGVAPATELEQRLAHQLDGPGIQQRGYTTRPRPVRVRGHAENMDVASARLDHEVHVDAAQRDRAVDVEEITRKHGGGLGAQELRHVDRLRCGAAVSAAVSGSAALWRRRPGCPSRAVRLGSAGTCGCRNLCHQAIFMNHASGVVTPLDPELIQVGDAVGQRAQRRGLLESAVRPVGVIEVLLLAQDGHQVPLVPYQGPVEQLPPAAADPALHDRIHSSRLNG
jgi:hypothetical protein